MKCQGYDNKVRIDNDNANDRTIKLGLIMTMPRVGQ